MRQHDAMDRIIINLADGDPDKIRRYREAFTHTEIVIAWKSKLING